MRGRRIWKGLAAVAFSLAAAALSASGARAQWQVESKDGKANFKFGVLVQGQYEGVETETASTGEKDWSQNLFLRRARLIFAGKYEKVSFFVETDSPNLGKWEKSTTATDIGKKNAGDMYIQDAWLTYTHNDAFMVDAGMFLVPVSYQSLQSAATLMAVDFGPFAFQDSAPTDERVGRDYGFQLRGYPVNKHLEYRVGLVQGLRNYDLDATGTALNRNNQPFRAFGRMQYHVFDPQTGFLYTGATLGEKKILDIGATYTRQADYKTWSGSVFFDFPIDGNGLTLQADYVDYDGGTTLPLAATPPTLGNLGKENVAFFEAGFYIKVVKLLPFVQWSQVEYGDVPPTNTSLHTEQDKLQLGLAWLPYGHKFNLKLAYGQIGTDRNATEVPDQHQFVFQAQLFYF